MITLSTKKQKEGQIQGKKIHIYLWIQLYSCTDYFVELWLTSCSQHTRTLEGKCLTRKHNSKVTYQSNFWAWASGLPTFMHSPGASRDIKSSHTPSFLNMKTSKLTTETSPTNQKGGGSAWTRESQLVTKRYTLHQYTEDLQIQLKRLKVSLLRSDSLVNVMLCNLILHSTPTQSYL